MAAYGLREQAFSLRIRLEPEGHIVEVINGRQRYRLERSLDLGVYRS
jgi:hypothetical protein